MVKNSIPFSSFPGAQSMTSTKQCFLIPDVILEYFLEAAMNNFSIGRVDQTLWHPDYCSNRVVLYVLVKK